MFQAGPARLYKSEGPTKRLSQIAVKANSRSIRSRLCFPKVPVPVCLTTKPRYSAFPTDRSLYVFWKR
jgi:hypothetical protein